MGLRVTDNGGATATTTRTVSVVEAHAPTRLVHRLAEPCPRPAAQVSFDGSGSYDPDGRSPNTNGTSTATAATRPARGRRRRRTRRYAERRRMPRSSCGSPTTPATRGHDPDGHERRLATSSASLDPGTGRLLAPGRRGRHHPRRRRSAPMPGDPQGGVTLAHAGSTRGRPEHRGQLRRQHRRRRAAVDLSGTSQLTLEFWLNWSAYANNDDLAFEFTPNFNNNDGGFLVDPNAGELGGKFGSGSAATNSATTPTSPAQRRRLAPLRARHGHPGAPRRTGHPLRRRPAGPLRKDQKRHRRRQLRQLDALLHVARGSAPSSA